MKGASCQTDSILKLQGQDAGNRTVEDTWLRNAEKASALNAQNQVSCHYTFNKTKLRQWDTCSTVKP